MKKIFIILFSVFLFGCKQGIETAEIERFIQAVDMSSNVIDLFATKTSQWSKSDGFLEGVGANVFDKNLSTFYRLYIDGYSSGSRKVQLDFEITTNINIGAINEPVFVDEVTLYFDLSLSYYNATDGRGGGVGYGTILSYMDTLNTTHFVYAVTSGVPIVIDSAVVWMKFVTSAHMTEYCAVRDFYANNKVYEFVPDGNNYVGSAIKISTMSGIQQLARYEELYGSVRYEGEYYTEGLVIGKTTNSRASALRIMTPTGVKSFLKI
jgi:hypothetical protein